VSEQEFDPATAPPPTTAVVMQPSAGDGTPDGELAPVSPAMDQLVTEAITRRLRNEADTIAAVKFEELLTPELHQALQEATERSLRAQIEAATAESSQTSDETPQLVYGSTEEFVRKLLSTVYRREVTEGQARHWCPQWWRHGEATARLEALWRAWEHLRLDGATGMSVWWKDHADHHMEKLFAPDGTFKNCTVRGGHKAALRALPLTAPPGRMFPDVRLSTSSEDNP